MEEVIKIAFSVDKNFIAQLTVCITSILINSSKDDKFAFYLLSADITEKELKKIEKLKNFKDFKLNLITINTELFKNCPISNHIQLPTYFRFVLPKIISDDKILYVRVPWWPSG